MDINPIFLVQTHRFQGKHAQFDVTDSIITVKEHDEFSVNCVVEQSRPAALIHLSITSTANEAATGVNLMKSGVAATSLISTTKNVIQNPDKTFKTVSLSRLKAHVNDHGKVLACKAENGLSNQNWENRKILNILCECF